MTRAHHDPDLGSGVIGNLCRCAPTRHLRTMGTMQRSTRRVLPFVLVTGLLVTLGACGGGDDDAESPATEVAAAADTGADETDEADTAGEPAEEPEVTEAAPVTDAAEEPTLPEGVELPDSGLPDTPICDTIPTPAEVSEVVGEPFTEAIDQSAPLGDPKNCELVADTGVFVTFNWMSAELGSGVLAELESQGQVVPYENPDLPGATAYANTITVEHEGFYWEVQVVNPFLPINDPAVLDLSARLLTAWLERN